jgi:hypothetical protein
MSSRRVGQGRVYVQLGKVERVDFPEWCQALGQGRSYVSDGFAHAVQFEVDGRRPGGDDVLLAAAGKVTVKAKVAFAPETPKEVAYGLLTPSGGLRMSGDTVNLHAPRTEETETGGERRVDLVVNGKAVASATVPADGEAHELAFTADIKESSWVALRQFPQLHTNPVNVIVAKRPIRASRSSALWCAESIRLLWNNRHQQIAEPERAAAHKTYLRAIDAYLKIADECSAGS